MMIPMIPVLGREFGATSTQIGLLMSVYSLMQFIFSPLWGRLSDRIGRRPVLLTCLVGETVSYLVFASSKDLSLLFLSRVFAGFFGASISTASAYISDITPKAERSKGMALIGAAFGLGFVVGPAMGGGLTILGEFLWANPKNACSFAALCVAALCLVNFSFAYFKLKESLLSKNQESSERKSRFHSLLEFARRPTVGSLIGVYFLTSMAMAVMEATLILYVKDIFGWGLREVSFGFAYIGIISVFCQGYLVRKLLPKIGERKLIQIGLGLMTIGLSGIAVSRHIGLLGLMMTFLGVGNSFTNPSVLGSVSLLTGPDEQGEVMGTTQSLSALGRILGPALGGWMYTAMSITSPFITGGLFAISGLSVIFQLGTRVPSAAKK